MKRNLSKKSVNLLLAVTYLSAVCWFMTVVYAVIMLYAWGVYVDEHSVPAILDTHHIIVVIAMTVLFVLSVWSYRVWKLNRLQTVRDTNRHDGVLAVIGCIAIIPFVLVLLFFALHVFFVLFR